MQLGLERLQGLHGLHVRSLQELVGLQEIQGAIEEEIQWISWTKGGYGT